MHLMSHCKVRTNSFAFIASLPDETKDYLMKLKGAAARMDCDTAQARRLAFLRIL